MSRVLVDALRRGDVQDAYDAVLFWNKGDVYPVDSMGNTLLHLLAGITVSIKLMECVWDIADEMHKHAPKWIETRNGIGKTPLDVAVDHGSSWFVSWFHCTHL